MHPLQNLGIPFVSAEKIKTMSTDRASPEGEASGNELVQHHPQTPEAAKHRLHVSHDSDLNKMNHHASESGRQTCMVSPYSMQVS